MEGPGGDGDGISKILLGAVESGRGAWWEGEYMINHAPFMMYAYAVHKPSRASSRVHTEKSVTKQPRRLANSWRGAWFFILVLL
jgi:hypothetical protein